MAGPEATTPAQPPSESLRLIFEYDGDDVRLVSQQRVDVAVTGFDVNPNPAPGHYVELRSGEGDVLARVAARSAFHGSAEVFPEQPGEPITRVDVARPSGAFTVVVPAVATAERVGVVRIAPPPAGETRVAAGATSAAPGEPQVTELAEFPLES